MTRWVDTPGVDAAYGTKKSYLQPLRTIWEGTEGIAWLCAVPAAELKDGGFYLDRQTQDKNLDSWYTASTTNSEEEVQVLLDELRKAAC